MASDTLTAEQAAQAQRIADILANGGQPPDEAGVQDPAPTPERSASAWGTPTLLSDYEEIPPQPCIALFVAPIPGDMTIMFGDGGMGKGMLAAYLISEYHQEVEDKKVLIVDAEGHINEWARRVRGFGGDKERVIHVNHRGGELLYSECPIDVSDVGLIVVDSAAYFKAGNDAWGPETAVMMQHFGMDIGVPVCVLAHTSKGPSQNKAYGSTFWHNAPRASYELERLDEGVVMTARKATDLVGIKKNDSWQLKLVLDPDDEHGIVPHDMAVIKRDTAFGDLDPYHRMEQVLRVAREEGKNDGWVKTPFLAQDAEVGQSSITRLYDKHPDTFDRRKARGVAGNAPWEYRFIFPGEGRQETMDLE